MELLLSSAAVVTISQHRRYIKALKAESAPYGPCPCRHSRTVNVALAVVELRLRHQTYSQGTPRTLGVCTQCSLICAPRTDPHARHNTTQPVAARSQSCCVSYRNAASNGQRDNCDTSPSHMAGIAAQSFLCTVFMFGRRTAYESHTAVLTHLTPENHLGCQIRCSARVITRRCQIDVGDGRIAFISSAHIM